MKSLGRLAGIAGLELTGFDAIAQDQLGHRVHRLLVHLDGVPAVLHRHQDHVVDPLLVDELALW